MRLLIAAVVVAALALPASAGGLRHHHANVLAPLYGGGYTPLDCAATVFPAPRWCRYCGGPPRVSTWRRSWRAHRGFRAAIILG